jgi:hypothetical protein
VQGGGGAEEGGRERELVGEKQREEGISCHPFEPSEREVDVGEAGVGVWRERTSEKGGEGKEGRREEIGAKVGEKTLLTSLVGRGEAGRSGQTTNYISNATVLLFSKSGPHSVLSWR